MHSLCFIVESGTDGRLVEGLSELFQTTVFVRRVKSGLAISYTPRSEFTLIMGPCSRIRFAFQVFQLLLKRRDFDFVLVQDYGLPALAANLVRLITSMPTGMLVCSPVESYYRLRRKHSQVGKPYRFFELAGITLLARLNAKLGNHYIVLSRYLGELVKRHGFRGQIDIVPVYGVDTLLFAPARKPRRELRAKLGLPPSGSIIFFSSRIAPEKDSETLLAAFRNLRQKGADIWLLHRSGGFRQFSEEAREFGVADRIVATDAVHPHFELPQNYQASDLCVQASRAEGLGFSPLEALACGVPVIAAATGGLMETIIDGKTGWTYQVGNVDQLTRLIEQALQQDDGDRDRRAAAGRELVCACFDRDLVFGRLSEIVRKAISKRVPGISTSETDYV
jgi:glycosyltransferase involved in cell wall biosynthesis